MTEVKEEKERGIKSGNEEEADCLGLDRRVRRGVMAAFMH